MKSGIVSLKVLLDNQDCSGLLGISFEEQLGIKNFLEVYGFDFENLTKSYELSHWLLFSYDFEKIDVPDFVRFGYFRLFTLFYQGNFEEKMTPIMYFAIRRLDVGFSVSVYKKVRGKGLVRDADYDIL